MRWPPESQVPDVDGLLRTAQHVIHVRTDAAEEGDEVAGEALELAAGLAALKRAGRIVDAAPERVLAEPAAAPYPRPIPPPFEAEVGADGWQGTSPPHPHPAVPGRCTGGGARRWGERLPLWLPEVLIAALQALAQALRRARPAR